MVPPFPTSQPAHTDTLRTIHEKVMTHSSKLTKQKNFSPLLLAEKQGRHVLIAAGPIAAFW